MSGGSYGYLFNKESGDADPDDVERMLVRLRELGCFYASNLVRRYFAPNELPQEVRDLMRTVEWRDSNDIGDDDLRLAINRYRETLEPVFPTPEADPAPTTEARLIHGHG